MSQQSTNDLAAPEDKIEETLTTPSNGVVKKQEEEGVVYPGPLKLTFIMLSLGLAVFLYGLVRSRCQFHARLSLVDMLTISLQQDQTIIATAIPKITDDFHALADVGWYASAYLLTSSSFQLLFGKMFTIFSVKYVYLAAVCTFELGSLICATAPTSVAFIVGRAIAGIGAAGVYSGSIIVLTKSAPLNKRPMYTGLLGAAVGIASIVGPFLGGVFA